MLIKADMHCHSVASVHAYSTVREIAECASLNGLKAFALTDHAPLLPDSPHIWHFENMKCLPGKIHGVYVIKGAEVNIDSDGNIDLSQRLLDKLEWVVASLHNSVLDGDKNGDFSDLYINAVKNYPDIDVIGHCTMNCFPFDYERVLKIFKEYEKLVEINESSLKNHEGAVNNCIKILEICKKYEIPVTVDTDAHYCELVGVTPLAEKLIEETGFPKKLIVNSEAERIFEFIKKKRNISFE